MANIPELLSLLWLDAHYSGGITARGELDSSIFAELDVILTHPIKNHVILIDDARDFMGTGRYPTAPQLREYLMEKRPGFKYGSAPRCDSHTPRPDLAALNRQPVKVCGGS